MNIQKVKQKSKDSVNGIVRRERVRMMVSAGLGAGVLIAGILGCTALDAQRDTADGLVDGLTCALGTATAVLGAGLLIDAIRRAEEISCRYPLGKKQR